MFARFSREEMNEVIRTAGITTEFGPDSQSLALLRHDAVAVDDASTFLISLSPISDCWRSVTVVFVRKSTSCTPLAKRFRLIVLISSGLKMTEGAVFNR